MSWHYSLALVEEYSVGSCLGGKPCVPLSGIPTPAAFYWPDKTTGHLRLSRFGMTSEPLTADRGEALLTLFLADFRARTLARREKAQESAANEVGYGAKWQESFVKYDRATRSWKTRQFSLLGDCTEFSETWPRWGSMRNGECLERPMLGRPTCGRGYGLWPTPTVCGNYNRKGASATSGDGLATAVWRAENGRTWPTPTATAHKGWSKNHNRAGTDDRLDYSVEREASETGAIGRLNPQWVEWLMGWPIGWTELRPLGTGKFREWLHLHGGTWPD